MSNEKLSVKIRTESNLFIGGAPTTFEIGGIDLYTVTDYEGYPYIPASSFKGTLRNIVRELVASEDGSIGKNIKDAYVQYLEELKVKNMDKITDIDTKTKIKNKYDLKIRNASAEYLFGIEGLNSTPKLIFNDIAVDDRVNKDLFSIDSKNTIELGDDKADRISARPRTYKTIRPGVKLSGFILFNNIKSLNIDVNIIKSYVESAILELNEGIYRLGNSGSRGYGKVFAEVEWE